MVPAFKTIVSARSPVFRSMFCESFSESTSRVIETGFEYNVLKWLVEFCCTNRIAYFEEKAGSNDHGVLLGVLPLLDAANYYQIGSLEEYVVSWVIDTMKKDPCIATFVLANADGSTTLKKAAFCILRPIPSKALVSKKEIGLLSAEMMRNLVRDYHINASELSLFQILLIWAKLDNEDEHAKKEDCAPPKIKAGKQDQPSLKPSRWDLAVDMAKSINLTRILPRHLRSTVKESGLVSENDLFIAYESHMMTAENSDRRLSKVCELAHCEHKGGHQITVEGAGVTGVNGVHSTMEFYMGAPTYQKLGVWQNQECNFDLFWSGAGWVVQVFDKENGELLEKLYAINNTCRGGNEVPTEGWRAEKGEYNPVPRLILN